MKHSHFLYAFLPVLALSLLTSCNKNKQPEESSEPKPLEIGDTVKEWKSSKDLDTVPLGCADKNSYSEIVNDFGNEDDSALRYDVQYASKNAYIGSDVLKDPYFTEDDAKNGDIISLYVFIPNESNLTSLQLEVFPSSMSESLKSDLLKPSEENIDKWVRLAVSYDTLETLGAIRLNYKVANSSYMAFFFVDDINITLGEETVKTDYVYNDESLAETYKDYFKVGTCMSSRMLANTEIRKITKQNFNSITPENEGKPEQILDQEACQKLLKAGDPSGVAIKTSPFTKIYNFAEAHHIGVRHHTLVWFDQTPGWFFRQDYDASKSYVSKEVMLKRMENFIKVTLETINNKWPGLVYAIDVANEAITNGQIRTKDNNNQNPNNWYETIGKDFVYYAFKYARMYAKEDQKLYYNDYSYDYYTQSCTFALNTLLKEAIAENLIDGVGMQGHTDSDQNMDNFINCAKLIKNKGLECQITELDITINSTSKAEYTKQQKAYNTLLTKVLKANIAGQTNITGVIVWGILDNASWKRNQYPLLFTEKYGKKPAYYGFLNAIESVRPAEEETAE